MQGLGRATVLRYFRPPWKVLVIIVQHYSAMQGFTCVGVCKSNASLCQALFTHRGNIGRRKELYPVLLSAWLHRLAPGELLGVVRARHLSSSAGPASAERCQGAGAELLRNISWLGRPPTSLWVLELSLLGLHFPREQMRDPLGAGL